MRAGRGTTVTAGGSVGLEGLLEVVVLIAVAVLAHIARTVLAANVDNAILGLLVRVLVHYTARVDTGHLLAHERTKLVKLARGVLVAAVLGEEQRKAVVGEVLDLGVPARSGKVAVAPRVVVEGEKVRADLIGTAVHVQGSLETAFRDIRSRVADRDGSQVLGLDVGTQITGDGLDVWSIELVANLVDDLVTGEECEGVLVLGEFGDSSKDALEISGVVRQGGHGGGSTVDRVALFATRVDIENEVDASISQKTHALGVIGRVVDRVNTDSVDTEVLEVLDVTAANVLRGKRVDTGRVTTGLVINTANVEAVITLVEGWGRNLVSQGARHRLARGLNLSLTVALDCDGGRVGTLGGRARDDAGGREGREKSESLHDLFYRMLRSVKMCTRAGDF